jgi:hypothetical protein
VDDPTTNSGTPEPRALGLTESRPQGVVDPTPREPTKKEALVVVEMREPTVSCEVVAMRAVPVELETMMELGEKLVEPVPPYIVPIEVVAETTPALTWRGPFREVLRVRPLVEIPVVDAYGKVFAVVVVAVKYEPMRLLPKISPATESFWPGVEVPIPREPSDVKVLVAVAPNQAMFAEICVDEALAKKFCLAVQVLALPKLRDATTAPVVGEIVRVPFALETEETEPLPPPTHDPPIA